MSNRRVVENSAYWIINSPATDKILIPKDKGWTFNGDFERPTFSPSVLERKHPRDGHEWINHVFIRDGMIEYLPDCTHEMAGSTVEIPAWTDDQAEMWGK